MASQVNIAITSNQTGITVFPTRANVTGEEVVLVWTVAGAEFPETGFFEWEGSPPDAPVVTRSNPNTLLSAPYTIVAPGSLWGYVINVGGINVDPEVNNQPPGNVS